MHSRQFILCTACLLLSASFLSTPALPAQTTIPSDPIRVYSREVVIDVNVTDAKGAPVRGLTRDNVTITEDGKPISPRSFVEHRAGQESAPVTAPSLPPNTFSNAGPPEGSHPLNIILIDALDIPVVNQSILQKRATEFIDKLPAGNRVAIFGLSTIGQLSLIQGFTADSDLLKKAIRSHKLNIGIPPLEDFGQEVDNSSNVPQNPLDKNIASIQDQSAPKLNTAMECNHTAIRGQYTFDALSQIARYVSGMPGRKNLVWYTGLFPTSMRDKGAVCFDFTNNFRTVGERLSHSHIILYPVDPRALDIIAKQGAGSYTAQLMDTEHLNMEMFAEASGGKAFYNNNDLGGAAAQAFDAGANYYTVTYAPPNPAYDTRLHSVSIKVDQPGLTLVYRHAYHAVAPGDTVSGQAIQKATPLQTAMMRGALQPTEILFHIGVTPATAPDTALPPGNNADPKLMKPPFRHLTLAYSIDISGIQFDLSSDARYHGQFEYAVNVYDANDGKLVNSNVMAAKPALPAPVYQSMLTSGANLRQEIDLPSKGEYVLRIAVHDLTTDHIGALEIPVAAIHP
jgi:VWFA-related protein